MAVRKPAEKRKTQDVIWANLLHLSTNMWGDGFQPQMTHWDARPYMRFEKDLWDDLLVRMVEAGMNMVLIDVGDGVKYQSHPEISVKDAWTHKRLRRELAKIRKMGLEPIPKLNFSAGHDAWLSPYDRQVSTDAYYAVCRDVIAEVMDLFDKPRFFHLGMDEETKLNQCFNGLVIIRQYDLWWHDLYYLVDHVEKLGSRAWIWADNIWRHPEEYVKKMPRSVLQSNWYYRASFSRSACERKADGRRISPVQAYDLLEKHRFDQVPTGSNWNNPVNFIRTVRHCKKVVARKRLKGFLQTPWKFTLEKHRDRHLQAIDQAAEAIAKYDAMKGR